jgi:hypothetical protein
VATRSGDPVSDRINTMPKYVVSSKLKDPEWNNTTVIDGDPVGAIGRLKEEPGMDIVQYGFGQLSHAMLEHGLCRDATTARFRLEDTTTLESGIVFLSYSIAR